MRIKAFLFLLLLSVLALGGGVYLLFRDRVVPESALTPAATFVSPTLPLTLRAADNASGIKQVTVRVTAGNQTLTALEKTYPDSPSAIEETFTLQPLGLKDGEVLLEADVRDASLAHFGQGNVASLSQRMLMDTVAPKIAVQSLQHYVRQGGPGLVVYTLSEPAGQTGVQVGQRFFPGYDQGNLKYACFFAFPYDVAIQDFDPLLVAADPAGNRATATFNVTPIPRAFRRDNIDVSDKLVGKIDAEFAQTVPGQMAPLDRYVAVNRKVRDENAKVLMELAKKTTPLPLWRGAFTRMLGSPMAGFADHRTYLYNKQEVDQQTHLGVDIASHQNAEVPAGNDGVVVFAGYLGIYGNMVQIDHGMGLQTMYAHLSEILVREGESVKKGQFLGKTGFSGMALGDHLHFAVYLAGLPIMPIEWWDPKWIKDNVKDRLQFPGEPAPGEKAETNATAAPGSQPDAKKKPDKKADPKKPDAKKPAAKKPEG